MDEPFGGLLPVRTTREFWNHEADKLLIDRIGKPSIDYEIEQHRHSNGDDATDADIQREILRRDGPAADESQNLFRRPNRSEIDSVIGSVQKVTFNRK